jgi:hypothetical protein
MAVRPSAKASPQLGESVCIIVPKSATPIVPPICRVELSAPEAKPEFSGAEETSTPAVIAGIIVPMLIPSIPSPAGVSQNSPFSAPAASIAAPIAAKANPKEMRGRR